MGVQPGYDEDNREVLDQTPVEFPAGYQTPPTLQELIHRLVKNEQVIAAAKAEGMDTEEEADDFDVEEEDDMHFVGDHEFMDMEDELPIRDVELPDDTSRTNTPSGGHEAKARDSERVPGEDRTDPHQTRSSVQQELEKNSE